MGSKCNSFSVLVCVCVYLQYSTLQAFLSILPGIERMIAGLISYNMHPIASQYNSMCQLISAGSSPFSSETAGGVFVYSSACWCKMPQHANERGWNETVEITIWKNISAPFQERGGGGGGLGHRALLEKSQGNRRVESYLKGGKNLPSFNSSGLVRYGYAYWRHGRGGSVHQHASEHHRAWAVIRIVHWIIAYSAVMCMDDAWWINWR